MKKCMMYAKVNLSIGVLTTFVFIALLISPITSEARRGCCSHHGGVCGCACCDGTPLSAKCAPYYPDCSNSSQSSSDKSAAAKKLKPKKKSVNVPGLQVAGEAK